MEDNCFTMFCWFLPYINMNQNHMFSLPCPPSHLLPHPTPLGNHRAAGWAPCIIQQLPTSCLSYIWWFQDYFSSSHSLLPPLCPWVLFLSEALFSSVQSLSLVWLFATPWTAAHQGPPSITNSQSLLKFMSIKSVSQWCHPTISSSVVPFSSCLQSFPDSGSFLMCQLLASDGQSIGVSASASVLPMNIQDWFLLWLTLDLLAVQGTLKSLLQHHSSKASILWRSAFFMVLLSHHTWLLEKP